jgi:hypothetical protein
MNGKVEWMLVFQVACGSVERMFKALVVPEGAF